MNDTLRYYPYDTVNKYRPGEIDGAQGCEFYIYSLGKGRTEQIITTWPGYSFLVTQSNMTQSNRLSSIPSCCLGPDSTKRLKSSLRTGLRSSSYEPGHRGEFCCLFKREISTRPTGKKSTEETKSKYWNINLHRSRMS